METVKNTPFTTVEANTYFNDYPHNINYRGDTSFSSTVRAIYGLACERGEWPSFFRRTCLLDTDDDINGVFEGLGPAISTNQVVIIQITDNRSSNENDGVDAFSEKLLGYDGYHEIMKVQQYFKPKLKVRCFTNDSQRSSYVFLNGDLSISKDRFIQSAILSFTPWISPTEEMIKLEVALVNSTYEYMKCLEEIAAKMNLREKYIENSLGSFESNMLVARIRKIKEEINEYRRYIEGCNDQIREYNRAIYDDNIKILGMRTKAEDGENDSAIADYFKTNKSLSICNDDIDGDSQFEFIVSTYLEYYDVDQAKRALENKRSFIYKGSYGDGDYDSAYISPLGMAKLVKAIFVDEKLKLRVCGIYRIDITSGVWAPRGHDFSASDAGLTCLPNPHLYYYSCLGNYERQINECIMSGDYVMAVEQCVASTKSLNFGDAAVMNKFFSMMYGDGYGNSRQNRKCIELPTGKVVTPEDALVYLKNEEREEDADGTTDQN